MVTVTLKGCEASGVLRGRGSLALLGSSRRFVARRGRRFFDSLTTITAVASRLRRTAGRLRCAAALTPRRAVASRLRRAAGRAETTQTATQTAQMIPQTMPAGRPSATGGGRLMAGHLLGRRTALSSPQAGIAGLGSRQQQRGSSNSSQTQQLSTHLGPPQLTENLQTS